MRLLSGISALCKNLVALIRDALDPPEKFWKTRGCTRASEHFEKFVEKTTFLEISKMINFDFWRLLLASSTFKIHSGLPEWAREGMERGMDLY